ncbi:DUF6156 family protein [Uliginosibacterium sp. TH139]|uniref:DUF6156 family protein n=1 Tax=Uliginosibacterium sp. TH139 TaxID=2067453 RepID=UPI000C79E3D8|nr:DUF6156 family protein [Uliginosibacterium sp. TH139]PLK47482.1 hypothetical protein C0V76_15950 [Uliginosibacterium sp. TH139]
MSPRFFLSYTGVRLPLQLVEELPEATLRNRNTWFRAEYDAQGALIRVEKIVYGEVEMTHRYTYDSELRLQEAIVTFADEEPQIMRFSEASA